MTPALTEAEIAELQKACDEASPAPWSCGPIHHGHDWQQFDYHQDIYPPSMEEAGLDYQPGGPVACASCGEFDSNGKLIALARNALPTLLAMHTQDRKNITDLESDLRRLRELVYFAGLHDKLWEEAQVREPGITAEEFQYLVQP